MRSTTRAVLTLVTVLALAATACGNSTSTDTAATTTAPKSTGGGPTTTADVTKFVHLDEPGVTDKTIRVGGVASKTNPLGGNYGDAFDGVKAYFAMVNDGGGMYGRTLERVSEHDDQVSKNDSEVDALLAQDNVFAVLPVSSLLFTGAQKLADEGIPTFGWNIQKEWSLGPNMFGDKGSFICLGCTGPVWPWVANKLGRTKVGILAYGIADQSKTCAAGWKKSIEVLGGDTNVVFFDDSLPYGVPDVSGEVSKMKDEGVDLIMTCMDQNGVVNLAREVRRQNLDAVQFLPNAYDPQFTEQFGDLFEGSVVGVQFWPFEEKTDQPKGMQEFNTWMSKTGGKKNEISMAGWLAADMFVRGLRGAGPEFDHQKVVDAVNALTHWTADGLTPGFDWTIAHEKDQPDACFALVEVRDGEFQPAFGEPGKPFVCLPNGTTELPTEAEIRS